MTISSDTLFPFFRERRRKHFWMKRCEWLQVLALALPRVQCKSVGAPTYSVDTDTVYGANSAFLGDQLHCSKGKLR